MHCGRTAHSGGLATNYLYSRRFEPGGNLAPCASLCLVQYRTNHHVAHRKCAAAATQSKLTMIQAPNTRYINDILGNQHVNTNTMRRISKQLTLVYGWLLWCHRYLFKRKSVLAGACLMELAPRPCCVGVGVQRPPPHTGGRMCNINDMALDST